MSRFISKSIWTSLALSALCLCVALPTLRAETVIKIAVVTPEGSTWTQTLRQMSSEIRTETNGEVVFRIYPGGVSGDELDVLRKMRANRIHGAGLSGVGVGVILPHFRILEAPLLCKSYAEVDYIRDHLFDEFKSDFDKKGFILLGFAEGGFVRLFSKTPIATSRELRSVKMWIWKGDAVAESFLAILGVAAYPLHLADVHTGLETGMIDAFYSPALGAVAFQWYPKVRYMLDYPIVVSTGAFLMNKRVFKRLSEAEQNLLTDTARKYVKRLIDLTRRDNQQALEVLQGAGIEFLQPSADQVAVFHEKAQEFHKRGMSSLYSPALFERVQRLLEEYRRQHGNTEK